MTRGVKIVAVLVLAALLLVITAHIVIRTYISSRATETVKSALQQTHGDAFTFDTLLFSLLTSQAEIDNVSLVLPTSDEQMHMVLTADNIQARVPGWDLLQLSAFSESFFEISRGALSFSNPALAITIPAEGYSFTVRADQLDLDFQGSLTQQDITRYVAARKFSAFLQNMEQAHLNARNFRIVSSEAADIIQQLIRASAAREQHNPEEIHRLLLSLLSEHSISQQQQTSLLHVLHQTDSATVRNVSRTLELLMPRATGELIPSDVQLHIAVSDPERSLADIRGTLVNSVGSIQLDGQARFDDTREEALEKLSVIYGDIHIHSLHPEASAILGISNFTYRIEN